MVVGYRWRKGLADRCMFITTTLAIDQTLVVALQRFIWLSSDGATGVDLCLTAQLSLVAVDLKRGPVVSPDVPSSRAIRARLSNASFTNEGSVHITRK